MWVGRRKFLELGALSLVAPAIGGRWSRWGRLEAVLASDLAPVAVRPEYERTLQQVLICIPTDTAAFGARRDHDDLGRAAFGRFVDAVFWDLLEALPSYTTVHIVARSESEHLGLAVSRRAGERRSRLHLIDLPDVEIELWAQDLGEPVVVEGQERFLVAKPMSASMGPESKMSIDRKRVAELVFGKEATLEASFVFEGGNLAFDRIGGASRIFVGRSVVSRTVAAYRALGQRVSRSSVLNEISATFGGAEVVEMGRQSQSPLLQHIDQAFVILDEKLAVASRLRDQGLEAESRQLQTYAAQLRELGYKVHYIDHSCEDLAQYCSSVNVVPFVEKSTGAKKVLFPVFPGEVAGDARVMSRDLLRGKAGRAFDLYRDLGYEPTPLRDLSHSLGGNTHCIVNALR